MATVQQVRDLYDSLIPVTLNGEPAGIYNWSDPIAGTVIQHNGPVRAAFCWDTIWNILKTDGKFTVEKTPLEKIADLNSSLIKSIKVILDADVSSDIKVAQIKMLTKEHDKKVGEVK